VKLVADEGIDRQIVRRLREEGHEVLYVAELQAGITDDEILRLAAEDASLLITADKDFGDLVFRQHRSESAQSPPSNVRFLGVLHSPPPQPPQLPSTPG